MNTSDLKPSHFKGIHPNKGGSEYSNDNFYPRILMIRMFENGNKWGLAWEDYKRLAGSEAMDKERFDQYLPLVQSPELAMAFCPAWKEVGEKLTGWISFVATNDSKSPIPEGANYEILLKNGSTMGPSKYHNWKNECGAHNIVAYRIISKPEEKKGPPMGAKDGFYGREGKPFPPTISFKKEYLMERRGGKWCIHYVDGKIEDSPWVDDSYITPWTFMGARKEEIAFFKPEVKEVPFGYYTGSGIPKGFEDGAGVIFRRDAKGWCCVDKKGVESSSDHTKISDERVLAGFYVPCDGPPEKVEVAKEIPDGIYVNHNGEILKRENGTWFRDYSKNGVFQRATMSFDGLVIKGELKLKPEPVKNSTEIQKVKEPAPTETKLEEVPDGLYGDKKGKKFRYSDFAALLKKDGKWNYVFHSGKSAESDHTTLFDNQVRKGERKLIQETVETKPKVKESSIPEVLDGIYGNRDGAPYKQGGRDNDFAFLVRKDGIWSKQYKDGRVEEVYKGVRWDEEVIEGKLKIANLNHPDWIKQEVYDGIYGTISTETKPPANHDERLAEVLDGLYGDLNGKPYMQAYGQCGGYAFFQRKNGVWTRKGKDGTEGEVEESVGKSWDVHIVQGWMKPANLNHHDWVKTVETKAEAVTSKPKQTTPQGTTQKEKEKETMNANTIAPALKSKWTINGYLGNRGNGIHDIKVMGITRDSVIVKTDSGRQSISLDGWNKADKMQVSRGKAPKLQNTQVFDSAGQPIQINLNAGGGWFKKIRNFCLIAALSTAFSDVTKAGARAAGSWVLMTTAKVLAAGK